MKRKLIILALCLMLVFSIALAVSAENTGIERSGRYRTWIVCGIIVVVLIAALGIFA